MLINKACKSPNLFLTLPKTDITEEKIEKDQSDRVIII